MKRFEYGRSLVESLRTDFHGKCPGFVSAGTIDVLASMKYAWLLLPWLLPAQNASFSLSTTAVLVGASSGNATVQLVASVPTAAWTATSNASWLHLSPP